MTKSLKENLLSGSIDTSLQEIDSRSRDVANADVVIGPFGVLKFTAESTEPSVEPSAESPADIADACQNVEDPSDPTADIEPTGISDTSPISIFDSLSQMDDFLHWSDLLSFDLGQQGLASHPTLSMPNPTDVTFDIDNDAGLLSFASNIDESMQMPAPQMSLEPVSDTELLKDAQFLLKHFQDVVIPQIMAIPYGVKSPWKILNLPAAVVAFGDFTFLGTGSVSHARLANLYGLLACSAMNIAVKPHDSLESNEHWHRLANQLYQHAKDHMQISLQTETQGPNKAKYKDQLMAANILAQHAVSISILNLNQLTQRCII